MIKNKAAFALPLVLVMIVVCSIVGLSAFSLFRERGNKLKSTFARKQALAGAESGFNWAVSKLLQNTIGKRWYAYNDGEDCVTISDDNSGSTMEVFLCDVFNDRGELAHIHVFSRGSYCTPSSWKSESAICFGTVQITGDIDNLSAVILEKRILDSYRFSDIVASNEELFNTDGNKFAAGGRIFFDNATYQTGVDSFLNSVRTRTLEDVELSDHVAMRPVVALLEKYIQILNEIRIARVGNALLRNSNFSDIFQLASESSLSLDDLVSTLRTIQGKGEKLSSDRSSTLTSGFNKSQRELLIIYLLLKRIRELPSTTRINVRGDGYLPPDGAVKIAGLFYAKIAGENIEDDDIESIFDKILKMGKRLNEINVMRTFFSILDNKTSIDHSFASTTTEESVGDGVMPEWWTNTIPSDKKIEDLSVPIRDSLIEIARAYDWNSSRIPYGSYEGLFALDDDISEVEFERSLSSLNIYGGGSDCEKRSKDRVKKYMDDDFAEEGPLALQTATIKAGSLGMDSTHTEDYADVLHESAVDNGIKWLSIYAPSAETDTSPEEIGTMVEDIELATTSIFIDGDATESPFGGLAGSTTPTNGDLNSVAPDNGVQGIQVDASEGSQAGSIFIPTGDVEGTMETLNALEDLFDANNPDSAAVFNTTEVGGSNSNLSPTLSLGTLESDYLAGNEVAGDDAWITVGADVGSSPIIGDEPLPPPPPPPPPSRPSSSGNTSATAAAATQGGGGVTASQGGGGVTASPSTGTAGGDVAASTPDPVNTSEPNEGSSDSDARGGD